jgi:hypothetical protein
LSHLGFNSVTCGSLQSTVEYFYHLGCSSSQLSSTFGLTRPYKPQFSYYGTVLYTIRLTETAYFNYLRLNRDHFKRFRHISDLTRVYFTHLWPIPDALKSPCHLLCPTPAIRTLPDSLVSLQNTSDHHLSSNFGRSAVFGGIFIVILYGCPPIPIVVFYYHTTTNYSYLPGCLEPPRSPQTILPLRNIVPPQDYHVRATVTILHHLMSERFELTSVSDSGEYSCPHKSLHVNRSRSIVSNDSEK